MSWIDSIDDLSVAWSDFATYALLDGTLAFAVVFAIWMVLRRHVSARVGYCLFGIVLVKFVMPFAPAAPDWLAWLSPLTWVTAPEVARDTVSVGPAPAVGVVELAAPTMSLRAWMFVAWLTVVLALATWFVVQQIRTLRVVVRGRPLRRGELDLDVRALARAAGVRRDIAWIVTDEVDTPATGGLLRPYILLPQGLAPQLGADSLRWVLLHELAHIRRGDVYVALAQRLVQIVLFFHPVVWLINRFLDEQREFACDEAALVVSGARRRDCGEGFLSVVEWARGRGCGAAGAIAMFDDKSAIRRRLMRILHEPKRVSRAGRVASAVLALTVAFFVLPKASATTEAAPADQSVQDPRRGDPQIEKLQRELDKLRRQQAKLQRQLEQLQRGRRGNQRTGVRKVDPRRKGGVVIFDDLTDGTEVREVIVEPLRRGGVYFEDVTEGEEVDIEVIEELEELEELEEIEEIEEIEIVEIPEGGRVLRIRRGDGGAGFDRVIGIGRGSGGARPRARAGRTMGLGGGARAEARTRVRAGDEAEEDVVIDETDVLDGRGRAGARARSVRRITTGDGDHVIEVDGRVLRIDRSGRPVDRTVRPTRSRTVERRVRTEADTKPEAERKKRSKRKAGRRGAASGPVRLDVVDAKPRSLRDVIGIGGGTSAGAADRD